MQYKEALLIHIIECVHTNVSGDSPIHYLRKGMHNYILRVRLQSGLLYQSVTVDC